MSYSQTPQGEPNQQLSGGYPPPGNAHPPQRRHGVRGGVVAAVTAATAVVAVGAGLLIGWAVFSPADDAAEPVDAAVADLTAACDVMLRTETPFAGAPWDDGIEHPRVWEVQGVSTLIVAGALADPKYADWKKLGDDLLQALSRYDEALFDQTTAALTTRCQSLMPGT